MSFIELIANAKIVNATEVTSRTLVGYNKILPYPRDIGNCFRVQADDGLEYKVLNFKYENLVQAIEAHGLTYPLSMLVICESKDGKAGGALLNDTRIPHNWYSALCECCTPRNFLSIEALLVRRRMIDAGFTKEYDGLVVTSCVSKYPHWR